jgi:hypothetical protein
MKKKNINVRSTEQTIKLLKSIAKKMKLSQSEVIFTALYELSDLLKIYPEVDYRKDLGGFLLRKLKK